MDRNDYYREGNGGANQTLKPQDRMPKLFSFPRRLPMPSMTPNLHALRCPIRRMRLLKFYFLFFLLTIPMPNSNNISVAGSGTAVTVSTV